VVSPFDSVGNREEGWTALALNPNATGPAAPVTCVSNRRDEFTAGKEETRHKITDFGSP